MEKIRAQKQKHAQPDHEHDDIGLGETEEARLYYDRQGRDGNRDTVIGLWALFVGLGSVARVRTHFGGVGGSVGVDNRVEIAHELGGLGDGVWHDFAARWRAGARLEGRGGDFVTHDLVVQVMVEE